MSTAIIIIMSILSRLRTYSPFLLSVCRLILMERKHYSFPLSAEDFRGIISAQREAIIELHINERREYAMRKGMEALKTTAKLHLRDPDPLDGEWIGHSSSLPAIPPVELFRAAFNVPHSQLPSMKVFEQRCNCGGRGLDPQANFLTADGDSDNDHTPQAKSTDGSTPSPSTPPSQGSPETTEAGHHHTAGEKMNDNYLPPTCFLNVPLTMLLSVSFLDGMIFRFALCRCLDFSSAAVRFLNFRKLVIDYQLAFMLDVDVQAGLQSGVFWMLPRAVAAHTKVWTAVVALTVAAPPTNKPTPMMSGQQTDDVTTTDPPPSSSVELLSSALSFPPVFFVTPRNMDWGKLTPHTFRKAWFYFVLLLTTMGYAMQLDGIIGVNSMLNMSVTQFKKELPPFILRAVHQCMPMKLREIYAANQPWFFGNVAWPLMRRSLSEKMKQRFHVVGVDYSAPLRAIPAEHLLDEVGGLICGLGTPQSTQEQFQSIIHLWRLARGKLE